MAKLYYQGHGSYRITMGDGRVIYIDPFAGDGYDRPADVVLVSHQHRDHNRLDLITRAPGCVLITNAEALAGGKHNSFTLPGIAIQAVEAGNKNHNPAECVGFLLSLDGVTLYASGDTSRTAQMEDFAALGLDWAVLCGDGVYNMDLDEAARCAQLIGAKHNIPVHLAPGALFDRARAETWTAPNRVLVEPGEEIAL